MLLGRLGKVFGLEGALRFRPLGDAEAQAVFELEQVFVLGAGPLRIREVRQHGSGLLIAFDGVRRRERAQPLVNAQVSAPADALPPPAEGEQFVDALRGLPVIIDGRPFGTVADLFGVAGAELLQVSRPEGAEALIPFRAPYVQLTQHEVLVDNPPPGLIDSDASE